MCVVVWRRLVSGAIDENGAPVEVSCDVLMEDLVSVHELCLYKKNIPICVAVLEAVAEGEV